METDKVAQIIRDKTIELKDRNGDVVDATISPHSLINTLAKHFKDEADRRRSVCICGPGCLAEDCNFNFAHFITIATGVLEE